jgi:hypothetical protein
MIVIDSSALIEVLLRSPRAAEIEKRIFASHETLHAPHLLDLEVAQVLRRYCLSTAIFAPHHTKCKCGPELPTQPKNSNGFSWLILAHPRRPYII